MAGTGVNLVVVVLVTLVVATLTNYWTVFNVAAVGACVRAGGGACWEP